MTDVLSTTHFGRKREGTEGNSIFFGELSQFIMEVCFSLAGTAGIILFSKMVWSIYKETKIGQAYVSTLAQQLSAANMFYDQGIFYIVAEINIIALAASLAVAIILSSVQD